MTITNRMRFPIRTLYNEDPDVIRVRSSERSDLAMCWCNESRQPVIATRSMDYFLQLVSYKEYKIETIGRYKIDRGFVFRIPGNPEILQCWVNVNEDYYRSIYHRYLKVFHSFPRDARLARDIAVDHVLNRKNAKRSKGQKYLLLSMVDSSINSAFGAGFEKNVEANENIYIEVKEFGGVVIDNSDLIFVEKTYAEAVNIYWPLMIKIFAREAPIGRVSEMYVASTLYDFYRRGMLSTGDLRDQFGAMMVVFRSGVVNLPKYDAAGRVPAGLYKIGGKTLTSESSVATWLEAYANETGQPFDESAIR